MGYIYCAKFKDLEYVKIGKSIKPIERCEKIGVIDSILMVQHKHYEVLEGIYHNAFCDRRIIRNFVNIADGSTEFFTKDCFDLFLDLSKKLNLEVIAGDVNVCRDKAKVKFINADNKLLMTSYLAGYKACLLSDKQYDITKIKKDISKAEKMFAKEMGLNKHQLKYLRD